ncbi:YolD-like family protein [Planococcus halocryophilus]|uniref:YolD-like family protein n=1 Tax=Planococcus halocryophilus TaxID=1215089 RepID=UPI001F0E6A69|nr:YolD-like family protein [Planococcus halocryophilus]
MKRNKHMKHVGEIKDRGIIKWQGMFLTEHVELIKAWREKEDKVAQPDLTEMDLQLIQEEMELAMKRKCWVCIQTWREGEFHYHEGVIIDIDFRNQVLIYVEFNKRRSVLVREVVSISAND